MAILCTINAVIEIKWLQHNNFVNWSLVRSMIIFVINKYKHDYRIIIINCTGLMLSFIRWIFIFIIFRNILKKKFWLAKIYTCKIFFIHLKENLTKIVNYYFRLLFFEYNNYKLNFFVGSKIIEILKRINIISPLFTYEF